MSISVLVVDDVQDWRTMLVGLVQDLYPEAEIRSAGSLDEAKLHLQENAIDLAVVDVRLDESDENNIDGLRLMEHIFENYSLMQTIIITGYANIDRVKKALMPDTFGKRPAIDFIEKSNLHRELIPRLQIIMKQ